jgi:hypothetical protein
MTEEKPETNLDEKYELRSLKRGELKFLKKCGFKLAAIDKLDEDKQDEFVGRVCEIVMGEAAADELTVAEGLQVFMRIVELTYGDEEKNFSTPGAGTKAAGRKTAKPAGKKSATRAKKNRRK